MRAKAQALTAAKRGLLERMPMAVVYSAIVTASVLLAGGFAGFFSFNILYTNKMSDSWGIMFLELERQALHLKDNLNDFSRGPGRRTDGDIVLRVAANDKVTPLGGAVAGQFQLSDFGLSRGDLARPVVVAELSGRNFVVQPVGAGASGDKTLRLVPVDLAAWMTPTLSKSSKSTVYLATRKGRLVFSSDRKATRGRLGERPLVRYFIDATVSQGQMVIKEKGQNDAFGFFYEVPGSNLVLFAETPEAALFNVIYESSARFLLILVAIIVAAVALVQLPLVYISKSVKQLIAIAGDVAKGNFNIEVPKGGIGEIATLGQAYTNMARNLKDRDEALAVLNLEQKEKIRLDSELKIARTIQENLLPQAQHPRNSGLEVTAKYVPASEVAGDWYFYTYSEKTRESVICVADVSGHGAGSSMFTAIIAGIFRQLADETKPYPVELFLRSVNRLLLEFGYRQWHASIQVAQYVQGSGELVVHNAGHPPPVVVRHKHGGNVVDSMPMPSLVLGLSTDADLARQAIAFGKGDSLLLFTDGLYEARNSSGRVFGRKRIVNFARSAGDRSTHEWVKGMHDSWLGFRAGEPAADDLCIVAVKAA